MNNLCSDIGFYSLNKYGEQLCGDHIEMIKQDDNAVVVLADGLGSGVKANILSTLTAKIISTLMANSMSIDDCVNTMVATLPVCEERDIAYSTFTILHIIENRIAEVIEYDNPQVILIRNGKSVTFPKSVLKIEGKTIYSSKVLLRENDTFIAMSDGVIHAGVGKKLNYGWCRPDVIAYMEKFYEPMYTAKTISTFLVEECNRLYENEPGDDTTVCTVKIRKRCQINLMIGPPVSSEDDDKMLSLFFSKEGKHIICGGTTSKIAAEFLNKEVTADLSYLDKDIPPIAMIEGIDLVTEGVITISRVLEYAESYLLGNEKYSDWCYKKDGASSIARLLFEEATDINFYVGRAINPAHQNPSLPIGFSIKMRLIDELSKCLEKIGKRIKVSYF
ncbi:MAG: SpoIIE family protein phosphatase [Clostridia bacterium]